MPTLPSSMNKAEMASKIFEFFITFGGDLSEEVRDDVVERRAAARANHRVWKKG